MNRGVSKWKKKNKKCSRGSGKGTLGEHEKGEVKVKGGYEIPFSAPGWGNIFLVYFTMEFK